MNVCLFSIARESQSPKLSPEEGCPEQISNGNVHKLVLVVAHLGALDQSVERFPVEESSQMVSEGSFGFEKFVEVLDGWKSLDFPEKFFLDFGEI